MTSSAPARITIRRALVSAWDKTGIVDLAKLVAAAGAEIISTGGTAQALREAALPVTTIEALTGSPAILDGRVKTLHPAVFAAILARDEPGHHAQLEEMGVSPVDLVVVNLYPFETRSADVPSAQDIELIDIGGVALIRAAAKNWARVAVVCDPSQYAAVASELREHGGLSPETRARLAAEAFERTAAYDAAIAGSFRGEGGPAFPERVAFTDNQLHLWEVDVAAGKVTLVDTDHLYQLGRDFSWAPDSKRFAYVKYLPAK